MHYVDGFIFYYGKDDIYSNFYKSYYCYSGLMFPTVEHGFQWEKAITFGDLATASAILETQDPGEAKYLGKLVKGYNDETWKSKRLLVMGKHVKCKFEQNPNLFVEITKDFSNGYTWAEASKRDKLWGIGRSYPQAKGTDPATWPGENLMNSVYKSVGSNLIMNFIWLQKGYPIDSLLDNHKEED